MKNKLLRNKRESIGKTQADMAKASNVSLRAYQMYESGDRVPSVRTAIRIAQVLGTTVECLWDGNPTSKTGCKLILS